MEDAAGWVAVVTAIAVYAAAWLFCVSFVLGTVVTGWGPHDQLRLREALIPLWVVLSRDPGTLDRLTAILRARQEAAGELPYQPRHAAPPGEKRLLGEAEAHYWLYMRHWPPYL